MTTVKQAAEKLSRLAKFADIRDAYDDLCNFHKEGLPKGYSCGWPGFDQYFMVTKRTLNICSGVPSSGKSEWIESVAINLAIKYNWNILMYSPENFPLSYQVMKLLEKVAGKPFEKRGQYSAMTVEEMAAAYDFIESRFTFFDSGDRPYSFPQLMETVQHYYHKGYHFDMLIIDPWNELESFKPANKSETDYIGECLMSARRHARQLDMCIWIVVHPAKLRRNKDGTFPKPSMYDLSGSAHWYNKSDNAIILHRTDTDKATNLLVSVAVKKVRNQFYGRVGEHTMEFVPYCSRYLDYKPGW